MLRIVLDVNIVRYITDAKLEVENILSNNVYHCIRSKRDFKILFSSEVEKAYKDHFMKRSMGLNLYFSCFKTPLKVSKKIAFVTAEKAPCSCHRKDQLFLDCAYGGNANVIVSNDGDLITDANLEGCDFECLSPSVFLKKYCPEYR